MSREVQDISGYRYADAGAGHAHGYLSAPVLRLLRGLPGQPSRIFELGCGNGSFAHGLSREGFEVIGVDPSAEGIAQARQEYPHLRLAQGSAYDDLAGDYGRFPVVLSLEVVEHVYFPRRYAATVFELLEPGGVAIISTPYHGYMKNLALAVSGRMDAHFTALWDHGHIKFWSRRTLRALLEEAGFEQVSFVRVGRSPPLAKSMIAVATKPSSDTSA